MDSGKPMPRATKLRIVAAVVYAIAWFLPVVHGGTTLAKGGLPGWEALNAALSPIWDATQGDRMTEGVLSASSGLSNALFITVLFKGGGATRLDRVLRVSIISAVALNLHWLVMFEPRSDLLIGYYTWVASFALLAFARNSHVRTA